jgi:maltodextrin utilization protein YvdJ
MTISISTKDQDTFSVTVTGSSTTNHTVTVSDQIHSKLTGGKISKEALLEKSFEFLLQREPNTAILAQFKLEVISQYFPDYAKQASTWK